jgi:hypothetical protein
VRLTIVLLLLALMAFMAFFMIALAQGIVAGA